MKRNHLVEISDKTLVTRFQEGDNSAISELIYRYQASIYGSIYLLVKDKYLAEDIFQDTFLKIIANIRNNKYSEQGKFLPWSLRIAHNLCIDYFRKAKQQIKITLPDGTDIFSVLNLHNDDASKPLESKQTESKIMKLLDTLPIEQREVIILRIYGEMSFKDIAAAIGISINTALGRMRYALINLRKQITENSMVLR